MTPSPALVLDFRLLRVGAPGETLEALTRELGHSLGFEVEWSGRGADEGRDLIFIEPMTGALSKQAVRWLVQCKDFAQSGKSVREADLGSILDRVAQHRVDGLILVTTTIPSTGLKKALDSLDQSNGGPIRTRIWDACELLRLLRRPEASEIASAYFPPQNVMTDRLLHDMINSLVALRSNISMLKDDRAEAISRDRSLSDLVLITNSLAIIDDLRFQVEAPRVGRMRAPLHEECAIGEPFIKSCLERAKRFALVHNATDLQITIDKSAEAPPRTVQVDQRVAQYAFLELVTNAIRYRHPGQKAQIRISREDSSDEIFILVEDQGIGIERDEENHLFSAGFRGLRARRLSQRGSGLGLSNARMLMNERGGNIVLENSIKPTKFRLVFPVRILD